MASGYHFAKLLEPMGVALPTDVQVLNYFTELLDVNLSDDERTACLEYLNTETRSGVPVASPFDASDSNELRQRVLGLIWLLTQHTDYQTY